MLTVEVRLFMDPFSFERLEFDKVVRSDFAEKPHPQADLMKLGFETAWKEKRKEILKKAEEAYLRSRK
jgi:hypothetical protein